MIELLGKSLEELQSIFKTHNIQKFRAKQLIDYIYHRYVFDFQDMTQFPKELRQWLSDNCVISLPTLIAVPTYFETNFLACCTVCFTPFTIFVAVFLTALIIFFMKAGQFPLGSIIFIGLLKQ